MLLPLDALRALSLLVLLGHAALLPGVSGQYYLRTYHQSQAATAREREAAMAAEREARQEELRPIREDWRAFLKCSGKNNCNYQTGLCPQPDDKCVEMARHQCRCGCLGYPGVTMNSEVWDECWEACERKFERDNGCEVKNSSHSWDDWNCVHLRSARCRCKCAHEDTTTSTPAATETGDSGARPPEPLQLTISAGSARAALGASVALAALTAVTRLFSTRGRGV